MRQISNVAANVNPQAADSRRDPSRPSCVETYGITLSASEYFVREWTVGAPPINTDPNNKTPELSTVLRGMARNNCDAPLKNVHLRFVVHDDGRRKGDGFYLIDSLAAGESKAFERAWMGKVTSYEITPDH